MANAITAKLGVDVAPLKAGTQTAEQILKATSKKVAEQAKKDAAEAAKAQADATKRTIEGHQRAGAAVQSLTGNLLHAETGAQMASAGIGAIGEALKLGIGGTIALQVVTGLVDRMDDAVQKTKEFRDTFNHVTGPVSGAGRSSESDITGHLQETVALAEQIKKRLDAPSTTALNEGLARTVDEVSTIDGAFSKLWATAKGYGRTIKDVFNPAAQESKRGDEQSANNAAAQRDVDRLTDKRTETVRIREKELHISEAAAALARVELDTEEKKGAIIAMQVDMARKGVAVDVRPLLKSADAGRDLEQGEIIRKTAEIQREYADQKRDADAHLAISTAAVTSKLTAQRLELGLLAAQEARERERADESGLPEEKRQEHLRKANEFAAQQKEQTVQQGVLERSIETARANSTTAQMTSQAMITTLTNHTLGSKQQIATLEQQITNLAIQKQRADEAGAAAIDAQVAGLKAQAAAAQQARNMLNPQQKQVQEVQDRAGAKQQAQNERVEKSQAKLHKSADADRGKADTAKNKALRDAERERRENPKKANEEFFKDSKARAAKMNAPREPDAFDREMSRERLFVPPLIMAKPLDISPAGIKGPGVDFDNSQVGKAILQFLQQPARIA